MVKKVIINGLKKSYVPFRKLTGKRTNPFVDLRPSARISLKHFSNAPENVPGEGICLSKQISVVSKDGSYSEEIVYRASHKQINSYNKNKLMKSTDIRLSAGTKQTTVRTYDDTGNVTHIETEHLSVLNGRKNIQKCDINPETNMITKYEMIGSDNKTFAMFERDEDGIISHFTDRHGNEFRCDTKTFTSTMTDKNTGETKIVNYHNTAGKFYSYLRPQIHIDMKKYL